MLTQSISQPSGNQPYVGGSRVGAPARHPGGFRNPQRDAASLPAQPCHHANDADPEIEEGLIDAFLRRAPSAMISLIVHLVVLILLALLTLQTEKDEPLVIQVGEAESFDSPVVEPIHFEKMPEAEPPPPESSVPATVKMEPIKFNDVSAVVPEIDYARLSQGELKGYSSSFSQRVIDAQKNGIEIVVVFDSTGSMNREIKAVKEKISQIGSAVLEKIPSARFSIATYRDQNDDYIVRGLRLTDDVRQIQSFVDSVNAGGGGDRPEAVQSGMQWAFHNNDYRHRAQKVMLIFGDAPPHQSDLETCLGIAKRFRGYRKGRVFTVTCRKPTPMPEFYQIAHHGGGHAYVMANVDHLMESLLVIAFGAENGDQVMRFFNLAAPTEKQPSPRRRGRSRRR